MGQVLQYDTAANAIEELKSKGYAIDFNLQSNITGHVDQFKIKAIYRYEGETDPADEIIIYAIESSNGLKGTFITGYGTSAEDPFSFLNRLIN
jgi:hypothetical protein